MSIEILKVSLGVNFLEFGERWLEIWQFLDIAPIAASWSAMELEDLENLVDFGVTVKHGLLFDQFSENASNCPNIHTQTVLFLA